ncbi:MAG: Yip1 family protein [Dehalococcoidales bacterium]|nr:Yip1 family protein [Dehalococcoidales bacterium]
MRNWFLNWRLLGKRMYRAARLDPALFREVKGDAAADRQALAVVTLAGLGTGIGIGLGGFFKMAGTLSPLGLSIGLLLSLFLWLIWSWCAWFIGTKMQRPGKKATFRELLRATGFAVSPGILGIFVFIPVIGGLILLAATLWVFAAFIMALKQVLDVSPGRAAATWAAGCSVAVVLLIATVAISVTSTRLFSGNWHLTDNFNSKLNSIVQPYRFSIASWELDNAPAKITKIIWGFGTKTGNASSTVEKFFSTGERAQSQQDTVEKILEDQIKQTLAEENVTGFPPVNLQLSPLPRLLIISPRDNIESMREILLDPRLSFQQIESIEKQADDLGVSSLVVEIGGFAGAYPSMVSNNASLRFTIDAAVEEWLHQYLAFRPLGFRYLMDLTGIQRNYEIAQINEAVAGMVSEEIGAVVSRQYYMEPNETVTSDYSDFYREMREIRLAVDDYLSKGEIDAAEQFMEQKREELAAKGYYIRKLNQAYFAWHGTYANQPDSVSPIGTELRELRNRCTSVKQFLDIVSVMTSEQDLQKRLADTRGI